MNTLKSLELWFVTGSQHLYGEEALKKVAENSKTVASHLNAAPSMPVTIRFKSVVTSADEILSLCRDANSTSVCAGLIFWMHTFSPAQMWTAGLMALQKPFLHLHTQYNAELPWNTIDMDFMNLNQAAHGDREFGFMVSRLRKERTVVVGHWKEESTVASIAQWSRVAAGKQKMQGLKVARFGDNMRNVAVTEGDKVAALEKFGIFVQGFGMGDLLAYINNVDEATVKKTLSMYKESYAFPNDYDTRVVENEARVEAGIKAFLDDGNFGAFTDTFENLHGLSSLPGLAIQNLMAQGYGFGAEGDWKTSAMLHVAKYMSQGLNGGTSFMEDYTYHFSPSGDLVLGAHMLEVCPSIAAQKPSVAVHPLGIGGKNPPVRLVFTAKEGPAVNVSLIDLGNRFRLIVNRVETITPPSKLPNLPVAQAVWKPMPDLKTAAHAWILCGGAHHTVFSQNLDSDTFTTLGEMLDIEIVTIDESTSISDLKNQLRWNELYFGRK